MPDLSSFSSLAGPLRLERTARLKTGKHGFAAYLRLHHKAGK